MLAMSTSNVARAQQTPIQPGRNSIQGMAVKVIDGVSITCAGRNVALSLSNPTPVTFNSDGTISVPMASDVNQQVATAPGVGIVHQCDNTGHFSFSQIADGTYFVTTSLSWTVQYNSPNRSGSETNNHMFSAMIVVHGGETKNVTLGGDAAQ